MLSVTEKSDTVSKCWGSAAVDSGAEYRPMKYLLTADSEKGFALCNTVTDEIAVLTKAEEKLFKALPARYRPEMDELIASHFIVPVGYDEKKAVEQIRKMLSLRENSRQLSCYTVLPTTACNARCFYCFESNFKKMTMSDETADKLVEFIKAHSYKEKNVKLDWFGGEPTLCVKTIDRICTALAEAGYEYYSSMTSNGYLFDKALAAKAKTLWKLNMIQITLDGTEEVYNRVKAYVGVTGSPYKKVIDNIGYILDEGIYLQVRMNLDKHNADDLSVLIGELNTRFGKYDNFKAYVHGLFDNCGYDPVSHSDADHLWISKKTAELNAMISKENKLGGVSLTLPSFRYSNCMAMSDRCVVVTPDGKLAKCDNCCTTDSVGDLDNGITDKKRVAEWKETFYYPECADCPIFPTCINMKNCSCAYSCDEIHRRDLIDTYIDSVQKRISRGKPEAVK